MIFYRMLYCFYIFVQWSCSNFLRQCHSKTYFCDNNNNNNKLLLMIRISEVVVFPSGKTCWKCCRALAADGEGDRSGRPNHRQGRGDIRCVRSSASRRCCGPNSNGGCRSSSTSWNTGCIVRRYTTYQCSPGEQLICSFKARVPDLECVMRYTYRLLLGCRRPFGVSDANPRGCQTRFREVIGLQKFKNWWPRNVCRRFEFWSTTMRLSVINQDWRRGIGPEQGWEPLI